MNNHYDEECTCSVGPPGGNCPSCSRSRMAPPEPTFDERPAPRYERVDMRDLDPLDSMFFDTLMKHHGNAEPEDINAAMGWSTGMLGEPQRIVRRTLLDDIAFEDIGQDSPSDVIVQARTLGDRLQTIKRTMVSATVKDSLTVQIDRGPIPGQGFVEGETLKAIRLAGHWWPKAHIIYEQGQWLAETWLLEIKAEEDKQSRKSVAHDVGF
jgi:hypothetical protein